MGFLTQLFHFSDIQSFTADLIPRSTIILFDFFIFKVISYSKSKAHRTQRINKIFLVIMNSFL
jgi:hypothetical protein